MPQETEGKAGVDKELAALLKRAKTKPTKFAVAMKSAEDGFLILSKKKLSGTELTAAKKKAGGGKVYRGEFFFDRGQGNDEQEGLEDENEEQGDPTKTKGKYVFETSKEPPTTLAKLIKKLVKRQAGVQIRCVCRMAVEQQAKPLKPTQPGLEQEDEEEEGEDVIQGQEGQQPSAPPLTPDRVAAARQEWVQASELALASIASLASSVQEDGEEDSKEAADVLRDIADGFPVDLGPGLEALESAVQSQDQSALKSLRSDLEGQIQACIVYMKDNKQYILACENNPYGVQVSIYKPLTTSLKGILRTVSGA